MKQTVNLALAAALGSGITLAAWNYVKPDIYQERGNSPTVVYSTNNPTNPGAGKTVPSWDFSAPAEKTLDAVVHISRLSSNPMGGQMDMFGDMPGFQRFFFGEPGPQQRPQKPKENNGKLVPNGTGSGVIISPEGYIVTNNHVVEGGEEWEVTLHDNRTYKAKLIGTDPTTDLAVLQIKETGLATLKFANSDQVKVGNWVLAVGNPFNLTSTVTAGVVSAKGRNLRINQDRYAIESFIQTDAAVNPGNSGGALVNLNGDLIGINTAIASQTGSFAGYSFAIPSNLAAKIVDDLIKFGVPQRGLLGVMIRDVNTQLSKDKDLSLSEGAYVDSVNTESAAALAGVKSGDVITKVQGSPVKNTAALMEVIGRHRPGDKVELEVNRKGKVLYLSAILKNKEGKTAALTKENGGLLSILGLEVAELKDSEKKRMKLNGGLKVTGIKPGKVSADTKMKPGFVITGVNSKPINTTQELTDALKGKTGVVMLEGYYEDFPDKKYYAFGMD